MHILCWNFSVKVLTCEWLLWAQSISVLLVEYWNTFLAFSRHLFFNPLWIKLTWQMLGGETYFTFSVLLQIQNSQVNVCFHQKQNQKPNQKSLENDRMLQLSMETMRKESNFHSKLILHFHLNASMLILSSHLVVCYNSEWQWVKWIQIVLLGAFKHIYILTSS